MMTWRLTTPSPAARPSVAAGPVRSRCSYCAGGALGLRPAGPLACWPGRTARSPGAGRRDIQHGHSIRILELSQIREKDTKAPLWPLSSLLGFPVWIHER